MRIFGKNPLRELVNAIQIGWLSGKANKLLNKGQYNEALRLYESALKLQDNKTGRAALLECAAKCELLSGNKDRAVSYLEEGLLIYKDYKEIEFLNEAYNRVLTNLAKIREHSK